MSKTLQENLWRSFNYKDKLRESIKQILELVNLDIENEDTEDLEGIVDFPSFLNSEFYIERLAFENNTKHYWENSMFLDIFSADILRHITIENNPDIKSKIKTILINLTFNTLSEYKKFIESYSKDKL